MLSKSSSWVTTDMPWARAVAAIHESFSASASVKRQASRNKGLADISSLDS